MREAAVELRMLRTGMPVFRGLDKAAQGNALRVLRSRQAMMGSFLPVHHDLKAILRSAQCSNARPKQSSAARLEGDGPHLLDGHGFMTTEANETALQTRKAPHQETRGLGNTGTRGPGDRGIPPKKRTRKTNRDDKSTTSVFYVRPLTLFIF